MNYEVVKQIDFKDHLHYSQSIWDKIEILSLKLNIEIILTTEKDWIKIKNLNIKKLIIFIELNISLKGSDKFYNLLNDYI